LRILDILKETNPSAITDIDKKIECIKMEMRKKGIKRISSNEVLDFSGLKKYYDSPFFLLSESAHSNYRDMEKYLRVENELIKEIILKPNIERMDAVIYTAIDGLLIVLDKINNMFSLNISENLKSFDGKMKPLEMIMERQDVSNLDFS
jgi:hypothetical protein